MKRTAIAFLCAVCALALSACGNDDAGVPLAYVPAETPYLMANLEPMDAEVQEALLSQLNTQLPAQLEQYRQAVAALDARQPALASLLRAVIGEFDDKTIQQFAIDNGIDLRGRWALYGLGLSPVHRLPLTDPAKFEAYLARLEDAYGTALSKSAVDGIGYRHLGLEALGLQAIVAVGETHATLAMLPANGDDSLLRMALGLERPETSVLEQQSLADLAEASGYLPITLGYLDLTRLPELLIDGNDPLLTAIRNANRAHTVNSATSVLPVSCRADLERIARRMPMISFGVTALAPKRTTLRWNIHLADDIVEAFSTVPSSLPGLGGGMGAPFDLAIALPLEQARKFWTAQIDAIVANPFTCPAFAPINGKVAELRPKVQMLAIPPVGTLRGVRLSIDKLAASADAGLPQFSARLLIASTHPVGLLALAQAVVPGVAQLGLSSDGKPMRLPASVTSKTGQSGWAAMSEHAIAIGFGAGQRERLGEMLDAATGDAGDLARMHVSGEMYRAWIEIVIGMANAAKDVGTAAGHQALQHGQIEAMRKQADRIKQVSMQMEMQPSGLEITTTTELR